MPFPHGYKLEMNKGRKLHPNQKSGPLPKPLNLFPAQHPALLPEMYNHPIMVKFLRPLDKGLLIRHPHMKAVLFSIPYHMGQRPGKPAILTQFPAHNRRIAEFKFIAQGGVSTIVAGVIQDAFFDPALIQGYYTFQGLLLVCHARHYIT